ncbi:MAG: hypothetical protein RL701_3371 [Pseudomonadota bacterium]|jgi:hypothetical protein
MTSLTEKHEHLQQTVAELERLIGAGAFAVVDLWEGDPLAVGLASPNDARVLAHLVVDPDRPLAFFVELELPPQGITDIPYTPAGTFEQLTLSAVVELIVSHLGIAVMVDV